MFRYSLLQVTFAVSAEDGEYTVKSELFGVIEEPRDPALVTVATLSTFPPTSTMTRPARTMLWYVLTAPFPPPCRLPPQCAARGW